MSKGMTWQQWTEDEDTRLTAAVMWEWSGERMGTGGWGRVATALGGRTACAVNQRWDIS